MDKSIFLFETTPEKQAPTVAEANALKFAALAMKAGDERTARELLFSTFGTAEAERHLEELRQRAAGPHIAATNLPVAFPVQPRRRKVPLILWTVALVALLFEAVRILRQN